MGKDTPSSHHVISASLVIDFLAGFFFTGGLLVAGWYYFLDDEPDPFAGVDTGPSSSGQTPTAANDKKSKDRFPWEPREDSTPDSDETNSGPTPETKKKLPTRDTQQSTNDQLHFLAQMTFANGGLRAPSCPCCF